MQDVTELRRAERERELLERELLHAQRIDALGRLAGGIAHDVNNALVPVIGLTEAVLKELPPDSPNAEALAIVHDAGVRAKGLVKQILAFSRREPPNRQPIDLQAFLRQVARFVRATVPATIAIEQRLEPVPTAFADAAQLHQVMINLITNAVDAIGAAKGKVTMLLSDEGSGNHALISLIDSGCGMDRATLEKIFEPFFTTKPVDKGTGLGLSVVYGIVRAHDGQINVGSKVGKGTRVDILLPVAPAAQPLTENERYDCEENPGDR
jgi:signal transduction histidine kinase